METHMTSLMLQVQRTQQLVQQQSSSRTKAAAVKQQQQQTRMLVSGRTRKLQLLHLRLQRYANLQPVTAVEEGAQSACVHVGVGCLMNCVRTATPHPSVNGWCIVHGPHAWLLPVAVPL